MPHALAVSPTWLPLVARTSPAGNPQRPHRRGHQERRTHDATTRHQSSPRRPLRQGPRLDPGACRGLVPQGVAPLLAAVEVRDSCCTHLDFADVIQDTSCGSLLYLDPPYYIKGNDLYQHGFTVEDHERLAIALKNTTHAWVLSYDDCPEIRRLYQWARVEPLDVNYSITALKDKQTGERISRTKSELLIGPKQTKGVERAFDNYIQDCAG